MRVQSSLEADWDKRNEVVTEKVIRKAIRDRQHETIQDKIYIEDKDCCIVSNDKFNK